MTKKSINCVVSTCIARDAKIWKVAAPNIINHIESDEYVLIVPEKEISEFEKITPPPYKILSETHFLGGRDLEWVREHLPTSLHNRAGWYYQQLIKIDYLQSLNSDSIGLIWDADTVPIRALNFIDESNKLIFRLGVHRPRIHEPYFELIESLLGIRSEINESFISQCMPAKAKWVKKFCSEIEQRGGSSDWAVSILEYISKNPSACGFSEYESLGTYFLKCFGSEMTLRQGLYCRPANLFLSIDEINNLHVNEWVHYFEYLAFDSYLNEKCTGLNIGCGNSSMTKAFDGGRCINVDKFPTETHDAVMDLEKGLPFKNQQFTHIIAHNIFEHVDDLQKAIQEIDRLLAHGGILQIEVPHIGSYNHGTDITHKRGLTFDSFNFLISKQSYLFPSGNSPYGYKLISFNRENIINGSLVRESFTHIPPRGTYQEWVEKVLRFEIPGTFGFYLQKIQN
jgi:SAM-dependent methyltransferase